MTEEPDDLILATTYVENVLRPYLRQGLAPVDIALAMMAAGASLLVPTWGAERVLGAFDALVESTATDMGRTVQ